MDKKHTFSAADYFDLEGYEHSALFSEGQPVWDALKQITSYLKFRLKPGIYARAIGRPFVSGQVYIGRGTVIEHGAVIKGPAWIGDNCQIRTGVYIRENVIVGNDVVMGNSCEFKNSILFNGVQVPHFNYVGDSILGYKAHLGAGVILSNVRLDHHEIMVPGEDGMIATGLKKFGAIIGDHAEIGCNSVLSPGSIIGRKTMMYPGCHWRGVVGENKVIQIRQDFNILDRK